MIADYRGKLRYFVDGAAVLVALYHIFFISGLADLLGIHLFLLRYRAGSLATVLFLVFLIYPANKKAIKNTLDWHDILFIIMGVAPCIYLFIFAEQLIANDQMFYYMPAIITFIPLLIALLEAARRITGIAIVIIASIFFFFPMFQSHIPGLLGGKSFTFPPIASLLLIDLNLGILGVAYGAASSIIIIFILFSNFLITSGASSFFLNLALSIIGPVRGGAAKVAVIASSFFGTLSGSVSANVAATGSITIPMMKNIGYKPSFSGAVEAVSSNGGQLVPPVMGMVAFVMADVTGIPYWRIAVASILPAVLYYVGLFIQVDMEAAKTGIKGLPRDQLPSFRETMKGGWFYLLPLAGLIVFLIALKYTPEVSGLYAIVTLFVVTLFTKDGRLGPKKVTKALVGGARAFVMPAAICALLGIIMGSVMQTGVGIKISSFLIEISGGSILILLLLTAFVCYILGGEMGSIALYIMMVALTAPALLKAGIDTMPSHLFVLWYGLTSFITPPVCIAIYVACSISGSSIWKTAFTAMRLGIATYLVPFMFVYRPALLMIGSTREIVIAMLTCLVGISGIAVGVSGHFLVRLKWIEMVLFFCGGILLIAPFLSSNLIGACLLIGMGLIHFRRWQKARHHLIS